MGASYLLPQNIGEKCVSQEPELEGIPMNVGRDRCLPTDDESRPTLWPSQRLVQPTTTQPVEPNWVERRISPRSVALEFRSWLGWRQGKEFVSVPARLLDISRAGIAVETQLPPPMDRDVSFHLHPRDVTEQLLGEVVAVKPMTRDRFVVRIAFWTLCPEAIYRDVLYGPVLTSYHPVQRGK